MIVKSIVQTGLYSLLRTQQFAMGDRLGKLALSDTGLFRREMQVLTTCVSAGYPVACVIGGGYADDMQALVWRHSLVHRAASQVYRQYKL